MEEETCSGWGSPGQGLGVLFAALAHNCGTDEYSLMLMCSVEYCKPDSWVAAGLVPM